VSLVALDRLYNESGKIGGPGHIIEIDESEFGKRKYNRGKRVDGSWILGMIDIGTNKDVNLDGPFRIELYPDNLRTKEALLPLIRKHVYPGTTIRTDCWRTYDFSNDDYIHETVNHTLYYKDPITGVHTNDIESNWRPLKRALQGSKKKYFADHLCEYLWRREIRKKSGDFFENVIKDISLLIWKQFDSFDDEFQLQEIRQSYEDESEEKISASPKRKYSRQKIINSQLFS